MTITSHEGRSCTVYLIPSVTSILSGASGGTTVPRIDAYECASAPLEGAEQRGFGTQTGRRRGERHPWAVSMTVYMRIQSNAQRRQLDV